jgi:hypothetical protein
VVVKENLSGFRPVETSDTVKKGRLTGTIGPDNTVDAMFFDSYIQIAYRDQPAEAFCNSLCGKNGHRGFLPKCTRRSGYQKIRMQVTRPQQSGKRRQELLS